MKINLIKSEIVEVRENGDEITLFVFTCEDIDGVQYAESLVINVSDVEEKRLEQMFRIECLEKYKVGYKYGV
jgi:hypothetical protein